jgi:ABC-type phosphate transport system substrate-binding protein
MRSARQLMKLDAFQGRLPLYCFLFVFSYLTGATINRSAIANESPRAGLVVVAGSDFSMSKLTKSEVGAIFLQKRVNGPGEQPLVPVFLPASSDTATEFAENVLGKSPKQLRAYWNLKVLTGRLKPPVVVETTEELVTYLNRNPGSIGYMSESALKSGLKVLYRDETSP